MVVLEANEKVQLDIAGLMPRELNQDAYILVAISTFLKYPTIKEVPNTIADTANKIMQKFILNNGVPSPISCDQSQTF